MPEEILDSRKQFFDLLKTEDTLGYAEFTFHQGGDTPVSGLCKFAQPKKKDAAGTAAVLRETADRLGALPAFDVETIEEAVRRLPQDLSWKVRPLFMALRVAVTGSKVSPPLFESMEILGQDRTTARLRRAADRLSE